MAAGRDCDLAPWAPCFSISIRMSFFKKFKKSRKASKQPMSLEAPTKVAIGALGMNVDLDRGIEPAGMFRSVNSRN